MQTELRTTRTRIAARGDAAHAGRRGISLLEVLIAMFVLLFGLMGVAAIFPVGSHYATQSDRYDRNSVMLDAAFAELEAREMLNPQRWLYASRPDELPTTGLPPILPVMGQIKLPAPNAYLGRFTISYPPNPPNLNAEHPGYVYVIDPVGAAGLDGAPHGVAFPYYDVNAGDANIVMPDEWRTNPQFRLAGPGWPVRRVGLDVDPRYGDSSITQLNQRDRVAGMPPALATAVFSLRDDLANDQPNQNDLPGIQPFTMIDPTADDDPSDALPVARAYTGNYSWLATVVPTAAETYDIDAVDPIQALQPEAAGFGHRIYDVSVAIIRKRAPMPAPAAVTADPSIVRERSISAELRPGGDLLIYDPGDPDLVDLAVEDFRVGDWIALAGVVPGTKRLGTSVPAQLLLKWYRVLAIDDETMDVKAAGSNTYNAVGRRLMLDGPDWPATTAAGQPYISNLKAFFIPGVVGVSTRPLRLETASPWSVKHYSGLNY